jgi:ribosomal protein L22
MSAYAYQDKEARRTARARITGVNASYKDLCEVCSNVRRKDTEFALEFLGRAAEGKQAILMAQHGKRRGHRRELGGRRGGFPKKSAKIVLGVLEGANANAIKLGLGPTRIAHIMANKQHTYPRMSPKGRRIVHNYETAIVEIVLEEFQKKAERKSEAKKAEAKPVEKKAEAQKTDAEQKKSAMSSSDTKRPVENLKQDTVRKEAQRI